MEKVNLLLAAARLPVEAGYAEKFASHGYDDIQFVLGLNPSGLKTLKEETKCLQVISPGSKKQF